ncbi:hypothetical protein AVEN_186849-1 [Araneus ventricosus]|uniref:Uncharacterized protein n=1 Tax=Araneus ventricosus TaxID=182803 RepID=A0A4Y2III1_ARAVE|nr:hypothetical protein AVEN_186849-1 [Araneus ventricosus]
MCHARWLIRANRLLRLYVLMESSENSGFLSKFDRTIKMEHGTCSNSSLQLDTELKAQVYPVIQRNRYFAHPEGLLIAMLTDSNHIRDFENPQHSRKLVLIV